MRIPSGEEDSLVLGWAIDAGKALCDGPLTGTWAAEIHMPIT
jgi:hypothetical protein